MDWQGCFKEAVCVWNGQRRHDVVTVAASCQQHDKAAAAAACCWFYAGWFCLIIILFYFVWVVRGGNYLRFLEEMGPELDPDLTGETLEALEKRVLLWTAPPTGERRWQ